MCILCRSDLKCSKSLILNCAPLFVRLRDRHNILLMNTVKTSSSSLPPPPVSSTDNKKNEKQSRTRQKTVKVNAGISEHDLNIKMSHMSEWLEKGFHVSVFILKTAKQPEVSFAEVVSVNLYFNPSCCSCACWGDTLQEKPKAPSFQIGSRINLAGLFFTLMCID